MGLIENLEAQILERKAVDVVLEKAVFDDVPGESPRHRTTSRQSNCRFAVTTSPRRRPRRKRVANPAAKSI